MCRSKIVSYKLQLDLCIIGDLAPQFWTFNTNLQYSVAHNIVFLKFIRHFWGLFILQCVLILSLLLRAYAYKFYDSMV